MSRPPRQTDQRYRKAWASGRGHTDANKHVNQCFAGRRMPDVRRRRSLEGHVLFFPSAREACLSQGSKSRGGPKYGTAQAQTHGTVRTKVQCPIPPVELQTRVPFSSLFSVSVSTSTSHPSSSSPPTNHLSRHRPSFQVADTVICSNWTRPGQRRAERGAAQTWKSGARKGVACDQALTLCPPFIGAASGSPDPS